jgi:NAD(P)H-hydrate epimerase
MKVVTVLEMREIEQAADNAGISYKSMLENAGNNLGEWIHTNFGKSDAHVVMGLIGSGNNGGDTLVALSYLAKRGWLSIAYLVKPRRLDDPYLAALVEAGGKQVASTQDQSGAFLSGMIRHAGIILDGILGTGFKPPLEDDLRKTLGKIPQVIADNAVKPVIIAVDCPSGVDCVDGEVDKATLPTDYTACMAAVKSGLLKFPAFAYCGELVSLPIGLPKDFPLLTSKAVEIIEHQSARKYLPIRPKDGHKGTFGTCLILAGSRSYPGAAFLAGKAAYLSGTGLVEMIGDECLRLQLAGRFPEAIWAEYPGNDAQIEELITTKSRTTTAILVGPGIGRSDHASMLVNSIIQAIASKYPDQSLIIDADGLRIIKTIERWWEKMPDQTILTPHPGEMAVLTGLSVAEVQSDRVAIASHHAKLWQKTIILKGAVTIIAGPNGYCTIIPIASPALATAGTGDVLAGLVTGFCAQGVKSTEAAILAAYIHASAGQLAEKQYGQSFSATATDVLDHIPPVLAQLKQ